jgi:hypothetical protein
VNDQELGQHEEHVIGRALHALDDIELDVADDADVLEYHQVLSYLSVDEITPPPALEARVLDAARAARAPEVPSLAVRHRKARRIVAVGAAGAVAAAVTLVLIVGGGTNSTQTKVRLTDHAQQDFAATLQTRPDHHAFALVDGNGKVVAHVVMSGKEGALYNVELVPPDRYDFAVTGHGGEQKTVGPLGPVSRNGYEFSGPVTGAAIIDTTTGQVVARGMVAP